MTTPFGYYFTQTEDGFTVSAPCDRTPVHVSLARWAWAVERPRETQWWSPPGHAVGLVRTKYLVDKIAESLRESWKPRNGGMPPKRHYDWAVSRTAKAIHKRTMAEVERLSTHVPAEVLDVQRAVFASTFGTGAAAWPELYEPQYAMLRSDIKRYRAAAAALRLGTELVRDNAHRDISNSPEFTALETRASELGLQLAVHEKPITPGNLEQLSHDRILDRLACDWMSLFSPDGRPYRSLRRTLMNLPGGVPTGYLKQLAGITLPRPITDRLELLTLLAAHLQAKTHPSHSNNANTFLHATRPQIVKAMGMVADATHQPLSTRRTADIAKFVGYATDYPEEHHGTIVGLARRSIRWHRHQQQEEIQNTIERLGNQPAAAPPIPPPDEVEFLGDVHRIAEEGQRMGHCVASYATAAVSGNSYLFHVSYRDEEATIEVSPFGHVTQAQGPGNRDNRACRYGRRILTRWGSGFPAELCNPAGAAGDPWAPALNQPF